MADKSKQAEAGSNKSTNEKELGLPFGDRFGSVSLDQAGLRSTATVTDDGRVDISIQDGSKELGNLVLGALRRSLDKRQSDYEAKPVPRPRVSSEHPVPLNIVIHVVGSRGDVQPFVALGRVLKQNFKHRVRLATHPVFRDFVEENGLEFFNLGGDPAELMAFMVKNPGLMPGNEALKEGQIGLRRKAMLEIMQRSWRSCFERGTGDAKNSSSDAPAIATKDLPFVADAIIANPPSFGHVHCAERLGIPLHMMFTMPWSPTQSFPHPLSNVQSSNAESAFTNFLTYTLVELLTWQGLGDLINQFREITLGLPALTVISGPGISSRLRLPYTYCWSPALIPKPKDWSQNISISGFYFLPAPDSYTPSEDLRQFLDSGPPPVYIGFGSIVLDDPNAMTTLIFDAVKQSGQRALVSKGWGGFGGDELGKPDGVFMLGNVPHDWLFKHVSCVVHHGGAGTTAAGIAAGKPTVIVPFFGDQPFWGAMVARAGAGPEPIHNKQLTAEKLAVAIKFALEPTTIQGAEDMAKSIAAEDGAMAGAKHFHDELDMDALECSLAPGRKAAWKVKGSDCRLSPVAAAVLLQKQEIRVDQLSIYRPRDYDSSQGPWDPFTGGASALMGTIGSLMGGVSDIPTDIFRHIGRAFSGGKGKGGEESSGKEVSQKAELKPLTLQSGVDASKGAARIVQAGMKSPMDFTLALAKGFQNAPKLYGDKTVREGPEVTDFSSGVKAATVGLGTGFYDGISGLFTQPAEGAREKGFEGFIKGFGKAIGGIVLKPAAGIWGVPGYLSHGVYQELRKKITLRSDAEIISGRIVEGEQALRTASQEEQAQILAEWAKKPSGTRPSTSKPASMSAKVDDANRKLIQENVDVAVGESSRGNAEEDALVARAVEASLANALKRLEVDQGSSASSTVPTHSGASWTSEDDDARSSAPTLVASEADKEGVDSDEDENMKEALRLSKAHQ